MKAEKLFVQISRNNIIFWGSFAALILSFYGWRLKVLNTFPLVYDEGIHLILGKLWAAGYAPYREIFVSYPPYFLWSLGIPWKIFNRPDALQLLMATYALTGVMAVVYLGSTYNSRLAGLAAGLFLSFTPAYFIPSFTIMTEVPSISIAVAAIALAEKYRRSGIWGYALLAGIGLGFGLSLKILPYYALPLVGLIIISRHVRQTGWTNRQKDLQTSSQVLLRDLAIMIAGFLATFLLPIFLFGFAAFYEQVIGMRLVSREVELNPLESNNAYIRDFLFGNPGVLALALYGFVFVVARKLNQYWPLIVWFILVWVSLYFLVPLRDKHLPILLPVLTIFSGFAVNHIYNFLRQVGEQKPSRRSTAMLLTIVVTLGMFGWNVPHAIAENNGQTLVVKENKERLNAIEFINKIATPDDCVIADNPVFLYQTGRLPPPELSETSQTRIDTGHLTLQDIISSIETHRCHVVAIVTPRFGESVPGLPEWLAENYLGLYAQGETFVYFAPKGHSLKQETDSNYILAQNANFGGFVDLFGLRLSKQPWSKEKGGYISLFWQLEAPIEDKVIKQIIELHGVDNRIYQSKRQFFEGRLNPTNWHIGDQTRDTLRLDIPMDLPTGTYDLYLSLCTSPTEQCLVINNQAKSKLYLGQVVLEP